jgi:hypothetical protein
MSNYTLKLKNGMKIKNGASPMNQGVTIISNMGSYCYERCYLEKLPLYIEFINRSRVLPSCSKLEQR